MVAKAVVDTSDNDTVTQVVATRCFQLIFIQGARSLAVLVVIARFFIFNVLPGHLKYTIWYVQKYNTQGMARNT